jgi:hypothetical protein
MFRWLTMSEEDLHRGHIAAILASLAQGLQVLPEATVDQLPQDIDPEKFNRVTIEIEGEHYCVSVFRPADQSSIPSFMEEHRIGDPPEIAKIKATVVGENNSFTSWGESSTDLPAEVIGEVVVEALQKAWRSGEDPAKCAILVQFS